MRCEDLNVLLDQEPLRPEQRQLAERHLAACPKCSEAWNVYRRCAAWPVPQTSGDLAARIAAAIDRDAAGDPSAARQRGAMRGSRRATLLTAGFLLFGAALAATVAYLDRSPSLAPARSSSLAPTADLEPALSTVPPQSARLDADDLAAERNSGEPSAMQRGARSADSAPTDLSSFDPAPRFSVDKRTVLVLPDASSGDARLPALLEDVVAALRETDSLNVLEPERAMPLIAAGIPEERISELLGAGYVLLLELPRDGATLINATLLDGSSGTDAAFLNVTSAERVSNDDWSRQAASIARFVNEQADPRVREAATTAARDAVLNTRLEELERVTALTRLPRTVADGVSALPDDVVLAAVDMAAGSLDPHIRALVWRAMKGTGHPYAVGPLLQSLGADADPEVRAAAASTLEDFVDEPAVRNALQRAQETDVSAEVRARAAESLLTNEQRRRRARNEFLDEGRPPWERLRAMLDYAGLGPIDDEIAQAMIRFALNEESPRTAWHALGALRHPAFVEPLLDALRRERDPSVRTSMVFGLAGFIERPEVRERLTEARDEDPDFDVRRAAGSVLRAAGP